MKKYTTIILLLVSIISKGQTNELAESEGKLLCEIKRPFSVQMDLKKVVYKAYKSRICPKFSNDTIFKQSQLETPYSLIHSFLLCNKLSWMQQLFANHKDARLSEKEIEFRRKKSYWKNFKYEIICEMSFEMLEKEYVILMTYSKSQFGKKTCYPYVCEKQTDGKWKICSNIDLIDFSGYLYLNPKGFLNHYMDQEYELIDNSYSPETGVYYVNKGFFLKVLLNPSSLGSLADDIIDINKPPKLDDAIIQNNYHTISIINTTYNSGTKIFDYSNTSQEYVNDYLKPDYKSTPEKAIASWVFETNIDSIKKHSVGYIHKELPSEGLPYKILNRRIINLQSKIIFDYKAEQYAIIYFSQKKTLFDHDRNTNATFRAGERRVMAKWSNGEWIIIDGHLSYKNKDKIDFVSEYPKCVAEVFDEYTLEYLLKFFNTDEFAIYQKAVPYFIQFMRIGMEEELNFRYNWLEMRKDSYLGDFPSKYKRSWLVDWFSDQNAGYWKME